MVTSLRVLTRPALLVLVLAGGLLTASCGAADPAGAGSAPSEPSASSASSAPAPSSTPCGTATGSGDELTSSLVGLPEAEATARAEAEGLPVRVVGRGTDCYAVTADFRAERVNLDIGDDGAVRAAGRG